MNTKYGQLPDEMLSDYINKMINKVWKMLPMREENIPTLPIYIEATLREFIAQKELIDCLKDNGNYIEILGIIEGLLKQHDFSAYRSDVFRAVNLIKKLKSSLESED